MTSQYRYAVVFAVGLIAGFATSKLVSTRDGARTAPENADVGEMGASDAVSIERKRFPGSSLSEPRGGTPSDEEVSATASDAFEVSVAENQRLWRLREEGECVLRMEDPLTRKGMEEAWARRTEQMAARRSSDGHFDMYKRFGMSDEDAAKFDRHLSKIERATAEADASIIQLLEARSDLDARMDSLMTAEQKEEYRRFEEGLRSTHDIEAMTSFLRDKQVEPTSGDLISISEVIRSSEAYTFEHWGGAFGKTPDPVVGADQIARRMSSEASRVAEAGKRAVGLAQERGLSADTVSYLKDYYEWRRRSLEEAALQYADRETSTARMNAELRRMREDLMPKSPGK